jgi:hypothetical protein
MTLVNKILLFFAFFLKFFSAFFIFKGGVNNLHGMPGIISGIGGTIVAAVATRSSFEANGDTNRYKLQLS